MTATPRALLVHPGTQYSGRLAAQLERHGMLAAFHTGLAWREESGFVRAIDALPSAFTARLANRRVAGVRPEHLRTAPWGELATLAELRLSADAQAALHRRNEAFQRSLPAAAIAAADCVIGFDTSSWILARRAQEQQRPFVLDQSIAHPRALGLARSAWRAAAPDWPDEAPSKSPDELAEEAAEQALSRLIVVPSRFVARSLAEAGVDVTKIRVNPFGTDLERFEPADSVPPLDPLRFVFAGAIGPRKGLPLLLAAWRSLPREIRAELWVIGGGDIPETARREIPDSVRLLGRLAPAEVASALRRCHVFVFPSYFEGLAQVQVEAAASGLPVIGTQSSGCEEIVRDGETGFVLPTGDLEALRVSLQRVLAAPDLVLTMRQRLLAERAAWSWDRYGDRWAALLREVA